VGEALERPLVFVGETLEHVLAAAAGQSVAEIREGLARELERQRDVVAGAPEAWRTLRERVAVARLSAILAPLAMLDEDVTAFARGTLERTPAVEAVESFLEGGDRRAFLLLLGPVGTGKTLAATTGAAAPVRRAAVRWLEELDARDGDAWARAVGERALFATNSSALVLDAVRGSRPRPIGRRLALWRASELPRLWTPWADELQAGASPAARDVDVLVLDDLGVEAPSPRFDVALGELLEHRARRKTIITANLRPPEIRARYGDRVADRLNHLGRVKIVHGGSRRRKGAL
jgi:DNA replication protein DnaC